jgi:cobalt/nickel transport system permease protein
VRNIWFAAYTTAFIMLLLFALKKQHALRILSASSAAVLFSIVILLPSFLLGNRINSILIVIKVLGSVCLVNILSHTTEWGRISEALSLLKVPDIFIFAMDTSIRYIYILGELSLDMFYGIKSRTIGRVQKKYMSITGAAGTLFLKSREMAEEMYFAMECRGFTGEFKRKPKLNANTSDYVLIAFMILFIALFFIYGRM